jgi:hypothetical protein
VLVVALLQQLGIHRFTREKWLPSTTTVSSLCAMVGAIQRAVTMMLFLPVTVAAAIDLGGELG